MRKALIPIFSLVILAGYAVSKSILDSRVKERTGKVDVRYLPSPQMASFLSFGFKEAMADTFWIEALNYFGGELGKKREEPFKYLKNYIDIILKLDRYFSFFYDWASTVYIYNGQPITRESITNAVNMSNLGIQNLNEIFRYDPMIIQKGAFNYALDAQMFKESIPYFKLLGRSFPQRRDMLLVGSAYAKNAKNLELSDQLRKEYLSYILFESADQEELRYAITSVLNSAITNQAISFVKSLRVQMETDKTLKNLVEKQIQQRGFENQMNQVEQPDQRQLQFNLLARVNVSRNWLPPAMHALLHSATASEQTIREQNQ